MDMPAIRSSTGQAARSARAPALLPPRLLCVALAIALVSTIISMTASAAETAPGDEGRGYPSAEAAFAGAFIASGLAERGYRENREYAAAIYQLPDGSWHSTPALAGTRTESAIPYHAVPAAALQIVGAHTHGQPRIPEDPAHLYGVDFSQADLRNAVHNYRITRGRIAAQLLLTSELKVLRLTLSGDPELAMGETFVTSSEQARRAPGAIHGRMEVLDELAVHIDRRTVALEIGGAGRPLAAMGTVVTNRPGSD
jgi:hypothetical protein